MGSRGEDLKWRYEAVSRGDLAAAFALWTDDFTWQGSSSTELPGGGEHHGKEAGMQVLQSAVASWDTYALSAEEFVEDGDTVVVLGHIDVEKNGEAARIPIAHIWRYDGDRIAGLKVLTDTEWIARLFSAQP